MQANTANQLTAGFNSNFWKFWVGQTVSQIGSSFTTFALPLLIFQITGSAIDLALATGVTFLPYLLFGLVIGAWVDRTNRRRLMIASDIGRALLVALIPLLFMLGLHSIWPIYMIMFCISTFTIAFTSAQFSAIPNLVDRKDLVTANGRVQASYSAAIVAGPLLASMLIIIMPTQELLLLDALSFLISAISLTLIRASFDSTEPRAPASLRQDVTEGMRYVLHHPVLRTISIMLTVIIFFVSTTQTQLVLFAKEHLQASDAQVGLLYTAGGIGFLVFSLTAGVFRRHYSFSTIILGSTFLKGICIAIMGLTNWYWAALVLWGLGEGMTMLFNVNTLSLRQTIVPPQMLGRVMSIAQVLAWSIVPLGTFIGALVIEWTGNVGLVYTAIGLLMCCIAGAFMLTALGHADRYLPQAEGQLNQGVSKS